MTALSRAVKLRWANHSPDLGSAPGGGPVFDTLEIHFKPNGGVEPPSVRLEFMADVVGNTFCPEFQAALRAAGVPWGGLKPTLMQRTKQFLLGG